MKKFQLNNVRLGEVELDGLRSVPGPNIKICARSRRIAMSIYEIEQHDCPRFYEPYSEQWWRNGIEPDRDGSRSRCYAAEHEWWAVVREDPDFEAANHCENILEAARFVRDFISSGWFERRFPAFRICHVLHLPKGHTSYGGPRRMHGKHVAAGIIKLSSQGTTLKWLILHELAHAVLPQGHAHDRRWRRVYLDFIGHHFGQNYRKQLLDCYRSRKLSLAPHASKRKTMTPERKALLLAALAKVRAARKQNADLHTKR